MSTIDVLKERLKYACTHKDGAYLNSPNMLAIKQALKTIVEQQRLLRIYQLKEICFPVSYPEIYDDIISGMNDQVYDSLLKTLKKYNDISYNSGREQNYLRNRYIIRKYVSMYRYIESVINRDINSITYNNMLNDMMNQYPLKADKIADNISDTILIDDISDAAAARERQYRKWCKVLEQYDFNRKYKITKRINTIMIR